MNIPSYKLISNFQFTDSLSIWMQESLTDTYTWLEPLARTARTPERGICRWRRVYVPDSTNSVYSQVLRSPAPASKYYVHTYTVRPLCGLTSGVSEWRRTKIKFLQFEMPLPESTYICEGDKGFDGPKYSPLYSRFALLSYDGERRRISFVKYFKRIFALCYIRKLSSSYMNRHACIWNALTKKLEKHMFSK